MDVPDKEARCWWRDDDARERRAIVRRLATKRAVRCGKLRARLLRSLDARLGPGEAAALAVAHRNIAK